tara:strand:- start:4361 stop:4957 length:597 start_codon:yes stop_codon:yes gene_type:complete
MKKTLLAATTALAITLTAGVASAQEEKPLDLIDSNNVREQNAYEYEFNRDEQCQGYMLGVKRLGITDSCAKDEEEELIVVPQNEQQELLNEYVVYFDFDKANIRPQDEAVLRQAASEITKYNPSDVAVVGYTDTSGSMAYNQALSARRANAVSNYLTSMGVENYVVKEAARGETDLAVPTNDEVRMQENRRVAIQFLR